MKDVTVSVVSHGHNRLLNDFLGDLHRHCAVRVSAVITLNAADEVPLRSDVAFPVQLVENASPRGFGANHNAAFLHCATPYFCVANPDIRLAADPFALLVDTLGGAAVTGPLVRSPSGAPEDSARRFPTVSRLLRKLVSDRRAPDYPVDRGPVPADWIAGMFMLFRSDEFRAVGGFDERYFMYYEDVDICRRLTARERPVIFDPRASVTHFARRASRRNARHAWWHLTSMLRYFATR